MPRKEIDITGKRFGKLVGVRRVSYDRWIFRCDCGNEKEASKSNVARGQTTSCGCYAIEQSSTHRATKHPLYLTWKGMIQRCTAPGNPAYKNYGGRGIKVCEKWLNDPWAFFADVGERPPGTSLDRIDNNGHYEPGNVRWRTKREQAWNMRKNHLITYRGETKPVAEWAYGLGIHPETLKRRIYRSKWPLDRAFSNLP